MKSQISKATERNWLRLNTDSSTRLTKRANKSNSAKRILPMEYFTNAENMSFVQEFVSWFDCNDLSIEQAVYSFAVRLLDEEQILHKPHVQAVLADYPVQEIPDILNADIPRDEWDILGLLYQSVLTEGEKNKTGAYYTPESIAKNMTEGFVVSRGQMFLDPCCGSGSFLLAVKCAEPEMLVGVDNDPLAVFIAKVNLLIKYSNMAFAPQIFCMDYLSQDDLPIVMESKLREGKFHYIITNPPWGAVSDAAKIPEEITSKETFSSFFVRAYKQLSEYGTIRFLFPEALLNVKCHKDIRSFLLNQCRLEQITRYDGSFAGVTTKYIDILCKKALPRPTILFKDRNDAHEIGIDSLRQTGNLVFAFRTCDDIEILDLIREKGKYNLSDSIWALGIVTGDNKSKLKEKPEAGYEAIYTGKDILKYRLKPAKNYLRYDRSQLQQAAKEEYYRAPEKIVYKFISNELIFAYDNAQRLFLNSANILIPSVPGMSIKTVLGFLNSEIFQFFYSKMFGEVKILKGNLIEIPFPEISVEQNIQIESMVDRILSGEPEQDDLIQETIYSLYNISTSQREYIRGAINGATDKRAT